MDEDTAKMLIDMNIREFNQLHTNLNQHCKDNKQDIKMLTDCINHINITMNEINQELIKRDHQHDIDIELIKKDIEIIAANAGAEAGSKKGRAWAVAISSGICLAFEFITRVK